MYFWVGPWKFEDFRKKTNADQLHQQLWYHWRKQHHKALISTSTASKIKHTCKGFWNVICIAFCGHHDPHDHPDHHGNHHIGRHSVHLLPLSSFDWALKVKRQFNYTKVENGAEPQSLTLSVTTGKLDFQVISKKPGTVKVVEGVFSISGILERAMVKEENNTRLPRTLWPLILLRLAGLPLYALAWVWIYLWKLCFAWERWVCG